MHFWKKSLKIVKNIPNYIAIGVIMLYRATISPTVGIFRHIPGYPRPTCIFYPTCSEYGLESFKKYPFLKALHKTTSRIGRCHPGNEPKVDLP